MADEVKTLTLLRDEVLRKTRWGHRFFEEYWKYYYQISPPIAAQMNADSQLARIVRWSIVTPMVSYLKLLSRRPRNWDLEPFDPEWREFLQSMKRDMDAFLAAIELPEEFEGLEPDQVIDELNVALDLVLKEPEKSAAYLKRLARAGALPLRCTAEDRERLRSRLRSCGRTEQQIHSILGQ
jgi:hypothetical protein